MDGTLEGAVMFEYEVFLPDVFEWYGTGARLIIPGPGRLVPVVEFLRRNSMFIRRFLESGTNQKVSNIALRSVTSGPVGPSSVCLWGLEGSLIKFCSKFNWSEYTSISPEIDWTLPIVKGSGLDHGIPLLNKPFNKRFGLDDESDDESADFEICDETANFTGVFISDGFSRNGFTRAGLVRKAFGDFSRLPLFPTLPPEYTVVPYFGPPDYRVGPLYGAPGFPEKPPHLRRKPRLL